MYPKMLIDLSKLKHNANAMVNTCKEQGINTAIVTKVFCADEKIVAAFAETDTEWLADSRIDNIKSYPPNHGKKTLLLRAPFPSQAEEAVKYCDASLNSEAGTITALAEAANKLGKRHGIVLMVDVGDLREGIYFTDREEIFETAALINSKDSLALLGVGLNVTCYGAIIPTREKMDVICEIAGEIEKRLSTKLPIVSGGNSSSVKLLLEKDLPDGITNLRLGESIARGEETAYQQPISGLYDDGVMLHAALVEVKKKPSYPDGEIGLNAFGEKTEFEDKGEMIRGIVSIGRQDTDHEGLYPTDKGIDILGASSDHLIVDLTHAENKYATGDILSFKMSYSAILRGFTSKYVAREYFN